MQQFGAARALVEILADGRKAGLSSFFERDTYSDSIQHHLDSLAAAWGGGSKKHVDVAGEIDGPTNRMRATVLAEDRTVIGQVVLHYDPKDAICLVKRLDIVPQGQVVFDQPPIEEPPPTQQMLEEHQGR